MYYYHDYTWIQIALAMALLVLLARGTRRHPTALLALLAGLVVVTGGWLFKSTSGTVGPWQAEHTANMSVFSASPSPGFTLPLQSTPEEVSAEQPLAEALPASDSTASDAAAFDATGQETPAPAAPNGGAAPSSNRPDWIDTPATRTGSVYRVAIKSGLFVTRDECEQALAEQLSNVARTAVNLPHEDSQAMALLVDESLRQRLCKARYLETVTSSVGPMQQLHCLVEFDEAARQELNNRWRRAVVNERLGWLASGSIACLTLLAGAMAFLRRVASSEHRRWRKGPAAVSALLLLAGVACVVRQGWPF